MGNQLSAAVSVNLADVSTQYESLHTLGDPGRGYISSFHCLDRQAVQPTPTTQESSFSYASQSPDQQTQQQALSLGAQPGAWLEDSGVALTRHMRLDVHRRRRQTSNFVKHIYRQYATGSGAGERYNQNSNNATNSGSGTALATNASAPSYDFSRAFVASSGTNSAENASAAAQLNMSGTFAEHYQQYRELFLHRSEFEAPSATSGAALAQQLRVAANAGGGAGTWLRSSVATPELQFMQRADVPGAVRQLLFSASADLSRLSVSGAANTGNYTGLGGAGAVSGEAGLMGNSGAPFLNANAAATTTTTTWSPGRALPQDVVVKVFVTTEGDAEQQKQLAAIKDMMIGVGEQLSAIDATRTREHDDADQELGLATGAHDATASSTSSASLLDALLPGYDGTSTRTRRSSSVLYYTRICYPDRGRFSLLQRPYIAFSLPERLQTRPYWGATERLFACYQLLRALHELHDTYGVVHGDIKPSNVLVQTSGWLYVTDLALYKPTLVPSNDPAVFGYYYDTEDTRVCYLAPEKFVDAKGWGGGADLNHPESTSAARATLFPGGVGDDADDAAAAHRTMTGQGLRLNTASAAESANVHGHTTAMDVFSAGCTMAYILTGEHLLHLSETLALRGLDSEAARQELVQTLLTDKDLTDVDLVQLLCRALCSAPEERPTARQLLEAFTPRVFPVWFADVYEAVLPALLSEPADVQLQWLQSEAVPDVVAWCARRQAATSASTVLYEDTHRDVAEQISHLLLPTALSAIQTAGTNDGTLRGLTCVKNWFMPRVSVWTLLDSILPCTLAVVNNGMTYTAATRLIALRVLMAVAVRVLQQYASANGTAHQLDTDHGGGGEARDAVPGGNEAHASDHTTRSAASGRTRTPRESPPHPTTLHGNTSHLFVTCETLFRDLLLPCFAELVRLSSIEQELVLLELAHQLPTLLLLCRFTLESPPSSSSGGAKHGGEARGSQRGASPPSSPLTGTAPSFSATLQELLSSGWELLQALYKYTSPSPSLSTSSSLPMPSASSTTGTAAAPMMTGTSHGVVAALLEETPRVVAFLGEDRVHRDLLPLLTTLIASPPLVRRQLYPQSVCLHALLESPQSATFHFFVTEGLRQTDCHCLVRTLEAMTTVLSRPTPVFAASEAMPCVHQAVPLLLSASPWVFRAAAKVIEAAARAYRPSEVAVYLDAAVRPLLTRSEWPLTELGQAPRSVLRADLLTPPSPLSPPPAPRLSTTTSPSSTQTRRGGTYAASHDARTGADTTALSEEERFLLLEHVQLRRTLNDVNEAMDLANTTPTLAAPLNPFVVTRQRSRAAPMTRDPADNSSFANASFRAGGAGAEASTSVAVFEETCPSVLLIPPTAAARTGAAHAALLTRIRPFVEASALRDDARAHAGTSEEDTARQHVRAATWMGRPRGPARETAMDSGVLPTPSAICACPSRPLRPLSIPLASASVHMGAIYSTTPLAVRSSGSHVLLSAGAREEALIWGVDVDPQGIHGQLDVLCRVPCLASSMSVSPACASAQERRSAPTYLVAQRMDAVSPAPESAGASVASRSTSVVLGASDGVVRYYDAEHEQHSGYCPLALLTDADNIGEPWTRTAAAAAAVTALDVYSPHVFFAGTASGALALVDTRLPVHASSSATDASSASPSSAGVAWSTRLEASAGAISCLSALHYGQTAYAVVAATYGGMASLFDLRYQCRVAQYSVSAGMASSSFSTGTSVTASGRRGPSVLTCCPDPCTFAHSLRARFAHPGPALLLGASDGQSYRLQLRTGELSVALHVPTPSSSSSSSSSSAVFASAPGVPTADASDPHAVRAMLCQPHFGCVITGSEDGVLRQWQLPPCGASTPLPALPPLSPPTTTSADPSVSIGREVSTQSGAMACPPVMPTLPCERFLAPRTLVSSTPAYLLDECPALWPDAAQLSGLVREDSTSRRGDGHPPTMTPSASRHRVPVDTSALFPTVSLREQRHPHLGVGGGGGAPPQLGLLSLPAPRHHRDAVLSLAALWRPATGLVRGSAASWHAPGPFLVSGSRDGTLSVWQNEAPNV